jgi:hypothetical protein
MNRSAWHGVCETFFDLRAKGGAKPEPIMKSTTSSRLLAGTILATLAVPSLAQVRTVSVRLNGQPLALSAAPLQLGGRTLLPLRDVFESLGAQVNWNPVAQSIAAQSGSTQIQLGINNPVAFVNGRNVSLDQPAILVGGRAYVPLRFVAEATGATVDYNSQLGLVSIQKFNPLNGNGGAQVADYTNGIGNASPISVPADAVVPVQLDTALNSNTSRVGQKFTASVVSRQMGDSEFPAGTKLEGLVTQARPADKRNPGVLALRFDTAITPDGARVPLRGDLVSLDQSGVTQTGGRLVANGARKNDNLKVIGIGAGAGFVLGRILKTDSTLSTVLGAAGGYLFGRSRDKRAQEARLAQNTILGVRLRDGVHFRDTNGYGRVREAFLGGNTGPFNPRDYGYDSRIDGSAQGRYDGYQVSDSLPAPADVYGNGNRANPVYDDGGPTVYPDDNPGQNAGADQNNDDRWNNGWNRGGRNNTGANNPANVPDNQNDDLGAGNANGTDVFGRNDGFGTGNRNDGTALNNGGDTYGNGNALAQSISIPEGAVVPILLDTEISSATARVGDQVTASIDSQQLGDSEFPAGTRILGQVIEARPRTKSQPGVLDFNFQTAQLPDGTRVPLNGELISLDDNSSNGVQQVGGRLVARGTRTNKDRTKIIGIGAAAGFAIGRVLGKGGILPPVLGALGGYLYGQKNANKTRAAEAVVPRYARLGLRLDNGVSYNGGTYYASRAQYLRLK